MLDKLESIKASVLEYQSCNIGIFPVKLEDMAFLIKLAERYLNEHKPENQCTGCKGKKK